MVLLTGKILRKQENKLPLICGIYYLVMVLIVPGFFTFHNTWNIILNLIPLLIACIGQTYVMLTAGIDLSITSTISLTSVVGAYLMSADNNLGLGVFLSISLAILAMCLTGVLMGLFNGWVITRIGMPPFMVTLTNMMFFSGFTVWLTQSQSIYNLPDVFVNMPYSTLIIVPVPVLIALLILLKANFFLNKTLYGEWIYAVGMNKKAAQISGVMVNMTIMLVYAISGICAAVASIYYTARLETGSPVMGQNILLDVIGAVVIGGTSLFGGKGNIRGTFFGVLFIILLDNSLNLMGLSYFLIMVVKGLVILGATVLNIYQLKNFRKDVAGV